MGANNRQHEPHPRIGILLDRIKYNTAQIAQNQEELARFLLHPAASASLTLGDLADPIPCVLVGGLLHKRPDNVLRALKSNHCRVMKISGRWHCQRTEAAALWPKLRSLIS